MLGEVISFDENLEKKVKEEFGDEATPEFINMLRAGKAAYEHGYHGFISKEKFLEWVSRMHDGGEEQRKIRTGKSHGRILLNKVDIINAGSYLSVVGKKEGYLSAQNPSS